MNGMSGAATLGAVVPAGVVSASARFAGCGSAPPERLTACAEDIHAAAPQASRRDCRMPGVANAPGVGIRPRATAPDPWRARRARPARADLSAGRSARAGVAVRDAVSMAALGGG